MKIALAQISARFGDIDTICSRIRERTFEAAQSGARLICFPASLFCSPRNDDLACNVAYIRDVTSSFIELASSLADLDVTCLVPAPACIDGSPLIEIFMLKGGRVVPLRLTCMHKREGAPIDPWGPPVFDLDGLRFAVALDFERDTSMLPQGCDVILHFQIDGYNTSDVSTTGVASLRNGCYAERAHAEGVWLAFVAGLGSVGDAVYTGGSFFVDDSGMLVSYAKSFEEDIVAVDVERGVPRESSAPSLPIYNKEEWVWESIALYLRDSVAALGRRSVVLELDGDLQSSLLAVLAVDALGSRNVTGVLFERSDMQTPQQEAVERERVARVRDVAQRLHIKLVDRSVPDVRHRLDGDVPRIHRAADGGLIGLQLDEVACCDNGVVLYPWTKTHYALTPKNLVPAGPDALCPFGDVFLTELEYLARHRCEASAALPGELASLGEIEAAMSRVLSNALEWLGADAAVVSAAAQALARLQPSQVDGFLEAHVVQGRETGSTVLYERDIESARLLALLVKSGELARKSLPACPVLTQRSLAELAWPWQLAWTDLGGPRESIPTVDELARRELGRVEQVADDRGERVREEIAGLIGGMLGISPEKLGEMLSPEQEERVKRDLERAFEEMEAEAGSSPHGGEGQNMPEGRPPHGMHPSDLPFFSLN